eukprot:1427866-Rhodomonas_salina.7
MLSMPSVPRCCTQVRAVSMPMLHTSEGVLSVFRAPTDVTHSRRCVFADLKKTYRAERASCDAAWSFVGRLGSERGMG